MKRVELFLSQKQARWGILLIVMLLGACLRFTGVGWGYPLLLHPDEKYIADRAYAMAVDKSFDIQGYEQPGSVSKKIDSTLFRVMARVVYRQPLTQAFSAHKADFYVAGRCVSALAGTMTILLAFLILSRFGFLCGLIGALLFAVFPSFVNHSHYITPDIMLTFLVMATTLMCLRYLEKPTRLNVAWMSLFAAMAAIEKYPGAITLVIVAGVIIAANHKSFRRIVGQGMFAGLLFVVSAFLLSPILFTNLRVVVRSLRYESRSTALGADGLNYFGKFLFYWGNFIGHGGVLLFLAVLLGLFVLVRRRDVKMVPLLVGVVYCACISCLGLHWERWGVPVYAGLLLPAAVGVTETVSFVLAAKRHRAVLAGAACAAFALSGANLTMNALSFTVGFTAPDTRNISLAYCKNHDITQQNALYDGYSPLMPTEPWLAFYSCAVLPDGRLAAVNSRPQYIVASGEMYNRYFAEPEKYKSQVSEYQALQSQMKTAAVFSPVTPKESVLEPVNIVEKASYLAALAHGGYTGFPIKIYAGIDVSLYNGDGLTISGDSAYDKTAKTVTLRKGGTAALQVNLAAGSYTVSLLDGDAAGLTLQAAQGGSTSSVTPQNGVFSFIVEKGGSCRLMLTNPSDKAAAFTGVVVSKS